MIKRWKSILPKQSRKKAIGASSLSSYGKRVFGRQWPILSGATQRRKAPTRISNMKVLPITARRVLERMRELKPDCSQTKSGRVIHFLPRKMVMKGRRGKELYPEERIGSKEDIYFPDRRDTFKYKRKEPG